MGSFSSLVILCSKLVILLEFSFTEWVFSLTELVRLDSLELVFSREEWNCCFIDASELCNCLRISFLTSFSMAIYSELSSLLDIFIGL